MDENGVFEVNGKSAVNHTNFISLQFIENLDFNCTTSPTDITTATHRFRTHTVFLLLVSPPSEWQWSAVVVWNEMSLCSVIDRATLTFDLSTPNLVTFGISQGHSLYQVWTLWGHSFLTHAAGQTNRQTNRRTQKSYPRRPAEYWFHSAK